MALNAPRFNQDKRLQQAAENSPPLKQGERGEAVAIVQLALTDLGFNMPITTSNGTKMPDGIFGQETARVVSEFQRVSGLKVDGLVGRNTLARLEERVILLTDAQAAFNGAENRQRALSRGV
jgi:peptidoglycan hydrolase-like protein with peptidoglycan-binding domain